MSSCLYRQKIIIINLANLRILMIKLSFTELLGKIQDYEK